jgi:crotonobetainyl-CoA:carnitine CoA-transferase CaiB-like acyl-CoA transferase
MTQTQGPLSGVRIVEVSSFVAAPWSRLRDLAAESWSPMPAVAPG